MLQASDVAEARIEQAQVALASNKKMMDKLDAGTRHLKLFIGIALGVTEINSIAKAVGVIVSETFNVSIVVVHYRYQMPTLDIQRVEGISNAYTSLRDVVLELTGELCAAQEAGKHFESRPARQALDELIKLVIRACIKISECYSQSRVGESASSSPNHRS